MPNNIDDLAKHLDSISRAITALSKRRLLLGVVKNDSSKSLDNNALGFLFEFGSPETRLPARPFLYPTLRANTSYIASAFMTAMQYALTGNTAEVDRTLSALGMTLTERLRAYILAGISPPLSKSTLRKWIIERIPGKRVKYLKNTGKQRKDYGNTPLVVTGEFLQSLGYILEK